MKRLTLIGLLGLLMAACSSAAVAPSASSVSSNAPIAYEIVAQGDAFVGSGTAPITLALRGDDRSASVPSSLPDEAKTALQKELARGEAALYIVIYGGLQPSNGYAVKIESIAQRGDQLVVKYAVEGPKRGQGAADVITHPYVIARVSNTSKRPSDVVFEGP